MLHKRVRNPRKIIVVGLFFLVAANLTRYLPRVTHVSADRLDGAMGFFYGIAIGTLLLGVWMLEKMKRANQDR